MFSPLKYCMTSQNNSCGILVAFFCECQSNFLKIAEQYFTTFFKVLDVELWMESSVTINIPSLTQVCQRVWCYLQSCGLWEKATQESNGSFRGKCYTIYHRPATPWMLNLSRQKKKLRSRKYRAVLDDNDDWSMYLWE